ncbi:MAG: hypothetical protein AB7T10_04120 [bacterium]
MKGLISFLCIMISAVSVFSSKLTIVLEDSAQPSEIFINNSSMGTVKDSILLEDVGEGSYKISMFSGRVFDENDDSIFSENDKKARALGGKKINEAVSLGTESVFIKPDENKTIIIKNKQTNTLLAEKKGGTSACCLLGGVGGCCLGVLGISTLMVWMNNTIFAP